jgi:hypothetical protein
LGCCADAGSEPSASRTAEAVNAETRPGTMLPFP